MNRSYILSGLSVSKAQWNMSFDSIARRDNDGRIFASDKSRKYTIRKELELSGSPCLIKKHYNDGGDVMSLNNIIKLYGFDLTKKTKSTKKGKGDKEEVVSEVETVSNSDSSDTIIKLYEQFIDLRLFGFIINPKDTQLNVNSTGSFQIFFANDIHKNETHEIIVDITSYKASNEKDEANATIGKQILIDQGYLNYVMCIQPTTYIQEAKRIYGKQFDEKKVKKQFEIDKKLFLDSIGTDVSNYQSCTKNGVNNMYNIIIDMKDELKALDIDTLCKIQAENVDNQTYIDFENVLSVLTAYKHNIQKVTLCVHKSSSIELNQFQDRVKEIGIDFEVKDLIN